MGSAPPNCKFNGLLSYKCSKGLKWLQFFMYTQRANSDLSLLRCSTYFGVINYPNNTIIPEREGANDVGSEGGGEQLNGVGHTVELPWAEVDDQESRRSKI